MAQAEYVTGTSLLPNSAAGVGDSYDFLTNFRYWDFTVDDDNNNPQSNWFRFWKAGGNSPNDILMELGVQYNVSTYLDHRPIMNLFGTMNIVNMEDQQAFNSRLSIYSTGTSSVIESHGDNDGFTISSFSGNKITLGDDNDEVSLSNNVLKVTSDITKINGTTYLTGGSATSNTQSISIRPTLGIKGRGENLDLVGFMDSNNQQKWHLNMLGGGLNFVESNVADYRLFLKPGGNFGIGTSNPIARLDVNGTSNFSGESTFFGNQKIAPGGATSTIPDNLSFRVDGTHSYIESNGDEDGMHISSLTGNTINLGDNDDYVTVNAKNLTMNYGSSTDLSQVSINTDKKVTNAALTIAGATYIGPKAELAASNTLEKFKPEYLQHYNLWVEDGIVTPNIVIVQVDLWKDEVFNNDYSLMSLPELESFINKNKHLPNVPSENEVKSKGYSMQKLDVTLLGKIEELTLYTIQQEKKITMLEQAVKNYENLKIELDQLKKSINK